MKPRCVDLLDVVLAPLQEGLLGEGHEEEGPPEVQEWRPWSEPARGRTAEEDRLIKWVGACVS
jgi:hypothetical protein